MNYLASRRTDDKFRYCMVGYQVENTLTENNDLPRRRMHEPLSVAHIIERTAIHRDADGVIRYDADGDAADGAHAGVAQSPGDSPPTFLPSLDDGLRESFSQTNAGQSMKAGIICRSRWLRSSGQATAKIATDCCGVTYEDKPTICTVAAMTGKRRYPADL